MTVAEAIAALEAEHARFAEETVVGLERHRGTLAVITQALANATAEAKSPAGDGELYTYGQLAGLWDTSPDAARNRINRSTLIPQPVPRKIVDGIAYVSHAAIAPLLPAAVRDGRRDVRDGR